MMEAVISGLDNWILAGALLVQMGLISWLLVERGRRRRASEALDERPRFETLLADLSADFAGPDVSDGKISPGSSVSSRSSTSIVPR